MSADEDRASKVYLAERAVLAAARAWYGERRSARQKRARLLELEAAQLRLQREQGPASSVLSVGGKLGSSS